MKWRIIIGMTVSLFLFFLLVELVPRTEPKEITEQTHMEDAVVEQDTLSVWVNPGDVPIYEPLIEVFEGTYGLKVEMSEVSPSTRLHRLSNLDKDKRPDVITLSHTEIGAAFEGDYIQPLELDEEFLSIFTKPTLKAMTYNEHSFGVPKKLETHVLVYNKTFFDQAPTSIEDIFSLETIEHPMLSNFHTFDVFQPYMYGFNGYVFGDNPTNIGVSNSGSLQAFHALKPYFDPLLLPKDLFDTSFEEKTLDAFIEGTSASTIVDFKTATMLSSEELDFEIGFSPLPSLEGNTPIPFVNVEGFFVSSSTNKKEFAIEFMKKLSSVDNHIYLSELPEFVSPIQMELLSEGNEQTELYQSVYFSSISAVPTPNVSAMRDVWHPMNNALIFSFSENQLAEDAFLDAKNMIYHDLITNHTRDEK